MTSVAAFGAALDVGLKAYDLGKALYDTIEKAKKCRVELKTLLYLQAAQAAIRKLGSERQGILVDAARCDIRDKKQVEALSERIVEYLQKDNVRGPFKEAIGGLRRCREEIERAAHGLRWRKSYKQETVRKFLDTLDDLTAQAQSLEYDHFPEYSGQGLHTLVPVKELVDRIKDDLRRARASDVDADEAKLAELVRVALRDPAQNRWLGKAAHIEGLMVDLQLAFSITSGEA